LRSVEAFAPRAHVPLAPLGTLGVGGAARWFVRAEHTNDVAAAHRWCEERGVPLFVLGGGSNLVVADQGFDGLVLHVGILGTTITDVAGDTLVHAGAGEPWDHIVEMMVDRDLPGIECLSGIPGTVGGTPIQNVGAYGQEVSNTIEHVGVFDRTERQIRMLTAADCGFAYRTSRFKTTDAGRFVVCYVTFRFRPGSATSSYPDVSAYLKKLGVTQPDVSGVRYAVLAIRRSKGMVLDANDPDSRSVGSFFMNPIVTESDRERVASIAGEQPPVFPFGDGQVKIPAAWLIERSGFRKGHVDGSVGISTKHPLALVNRGGATSDDVLRLASLVKRGVGERFGVWLRPEPVFVGFGSNPTVEFLTKAQR
jgi:UDP-N-acetylmuramate dehydrogenase